MIELLATPGWKTEATPPSAWVDHLAWQGYSAVLSYESKTVAWLEVASLRLRGYVVIAGGHVEAINFEVDENHLTRARAAVEAAAAALGWEVDDEVDPEDEDDEA